jgi:transposase
MWLTPCRTRLGLFFRTLPNAYFNNLRMATFLEDLLSTLRGRIVVVWDGGPMHKGDPIRETLELHPQELSLEQLPPYAPMLNPVEPVWAWLKYDRLENFAPQNVHYLEAVATAELTTIHEDQRFLRALWYGSELPLPRRTLLY